MKHNKIIDMELVGNAIVISQTKREPSKKVLDAEKLPKSIIRIIQVLYKKGIDEIKVLNGTPQITNEITKIIEQRCIGFEIIDQSKDYFIIKDIAKESAEDFSTLLRRSFLIVLQLFEEENKENLENLDKSLNKITAYCQRLLMKKGYHEFTNINYYSRLCSELEHIGDEYKRALLNK